MREEQTLKLRRKCEYLDLREMKQERNGDSCMLHGTFSSPHVQTGSVAHPSSYPVDTGVVSFGGKAANHSPKSSAEIKNVWRYTSTSHTSA
jgi:hypothetical protein